MAVARSRRGLGLARALLREADARARALGAERIVLGAQLSAQAVYERAGYEAYGDVFLDAGIEHVMMARSLA
jgi:predicted GNAT family N-acyltransferase